MLLMGEGGHQEPITSIKTIESDEFKHTYFVNMFKSYVLKKIHH